MAAKRKKAAAGKKKAGKGMNVVVASKVKETIKSKGVRCAGETVEAVNAAVISMLHGAVARCVANKRGTVRPQDL
jgi:hypothetical protein